MTSHHYQMLFAYLCSSQEERKKLIREGKISKEILSLLKSTKLSGCIKDYAVQDYKKQWLLNQSYLQEIQSFSPPREATLLKGGHLLSKGIYPHIGERFMGDIDLLIKKEDLSSWQTFLENHGYKNITKDSWEANQFKSMFLKEIDGLELVIELHTRLFFQEGTHFEWNIKKENPYSFLSSEDLFIHLSGHLAYQHTFISLHWLYDLFLLVKHQPLNWDLIFQRAKKAKVYQSCHLVLWCLREHFQLDDLPKPDFSPMMKIIVKNLLTKKFLCEPTKSTLNYQMVKHITKDQLSDALIYDLLWLKAKL